MKCNSLLKLIFRHKINCIAFSLQIQSSQTARRIALTLETKNISQAIFYADTKTPHGEKNCSLPKVKAFSKLFCLTRILFGFDKKSTRQKLFTCMSDIFFAITKNPHGKKNCYMHVIALLFIKVKVFSKLN